MNNQKENMKQDNLIKTKGKISRRFVLLTSTVIVMPSAAYAVQISKEKRKNSNLSNHKEYIKHSTSQQKVDKGKSPAITGRAKPALPMIILDPGHGGKDPGAIGHAGTYEKHIAYATAVELAQQLIRSGKYRVSLTRTSDRFIPLDGRVDIAQQKKANLFVSMHADALSNASVRGASVYTLSNHASDAQSAALASVENNADRYGGPKIHTTSPEVQKILASLVKMETKRESITMAKSVVGAFSTRVGLLPNPRRSAAFVVLKSVNIPSILVEMGFMSNKADEANLKRSAYRSMIALSMYQAINRYFAIGGSVTHLTG